MDAHFTRVSDTLTEFFKDGVPLLRKGAEVDLHRAGVVLRLDDVRRELPQVLDLPLVLLHRLQLHLQRNVCVGHAQHTKQLCRSMKPLCGIIFNAQEPQKKRYGLLLSRKHSAV